MLGGGRQKVAMGLLLEGTLEEGSSFTGVISVKELGGMGSFAGTLLLSGQQVVVFLEPHFDLQGVDRVTAIDFGVTVTDGHFKLFQASCSRVFLHSPFKADSLLRVKEACSGIGALGRGGDVIGYKVVALNELQPATAKLASSMNSVPVVLGDINCTSVVADLWDIEPGDCVLTSGFSCQPYSRLGDRLGGSDPRSSALTGSLRAAYLMQCSVVLLECVQPAGDDPFVQGSLKEFQDATGFHVSQTVLELHKVWGARRTRWWALLTSPHVGPVPLASWKAHGPWHSVEDIIDTFNATAHEVKHLTLRPEELEVFQNLKPLRPTGIASSIGLVVGGPGS